MKRPIDYRDPRLVVSLVGALADADADFDAAELVAAFAGETWQAETVRRTLRDLVELGAVHKITPKSGPAAYRMTPLGRAWADRRLEAYVGPEREDDE